MSTSTSDRELEQRIEERRMFNLFLEHVDLHVVASSIEAREPPEPDILCRLNSGETVAFELGELSDQNARRAWSDMDKFRGSLQRLFSELPPKIGAELETLYRMCRIDVTFDSDVSLQRHEKAISALYRWLAARERFIGNLDRGSLPPDVTSTIPNVRITQPAPHLWIEPAFTMRVCEPDLSVFDRKLATQYVTKHPVELLLHSTGPLSDRWVAHYSEFLRARIPGGSFRRVWLFSPSERASETVHPVRFVYPADSDFANSDAWPWKN